MQRADAREAPLRSARRTARAAAASCLRRSLMATTRRKATPPRPARPSSRVRAAARRLAPLWRARRLQPRRVSLTSLRLPRPSRAGRSNSVASSSLFEPTPAASRRRWQSTLEERLESGPATALTVATTLWALVGDDIRLTAFRAQHDAFFLIGTLGCIAHFTLEGGAHAAACLNPAHAHLAHACSASRSPRSAHLAG
jgi:hypothetical protein